MARNSALFSALKGGSMQGAPAPSQSDMAYPGPAGQELAAPPAPAEGSPPSAGSPLFQIMHGHDLSVDPTALMAFGAKRVAPPEAEASEPVVPTKNDIPADAKRIFGQGSKHMGITK